MQEFRLYQYTSTGQLIKCCNGNKGHKHPTLKNAEEKAEGIIEYLKGLRHKHPQVVIVGIIDRWESKIVKIVE